MPRSWAWPLGTKRHPRCDHFWKDGIRGFSTNFLLLLQCRIPNLTQFAQFWVCFGDPFTYLRRVLVRDRVSSNRKEVTNFHIPEMFKPPKRGNPAKPAFFRSWSVFYLCQTKCIGEKPATLAMFRRRPWKNPLTVSWWRPVKKRFCMDGFDGTFVRGLGPFLGWKLASQPRSSF